MSESIIIMTTNLGAEIFSAGRIGFGESASGGRETEIVNKIESFLSPELTNRIDEIILFKPFSDNEFLQLASIYLDEALEKTTEFVSGKVCFEDKNAAAAFICSRLTARDKLMGARAVKRVVGKFFEGAFLEEFYKDSETGTDFVCSVAEDKLVFLRKK